MHVSAFPFWEELCLNSICLSVLLNFVCYKIPVFHENGWLTPSKYATRRKVLNKLFFTNLDYWTKGSVVEYCMSNLSVMKPCWLFGIFFVLRNILYRYPAAICLYWFLLLPVSKWVNIDFSCELRTLVFSCHEMWITNLILTRSEDLIMHTALLSEHSITNANSKCYRQS